MKFEVTMLKSIKFSFWQLNNLHVHVYIFLNKNCTAWIRSVTGTFILIWSQKVMIKRFKNKYLCDYSSLTKLVHCSSYSTIDRRLHVHVPVIDWMQGTQIIWVSILSEKLKNTCSWGVFFNVYHIYIIKTSHLSDKSNLNK